MPKKNKAKTAGKFVIIMLCFAILFFLLLPFLDNSTSTASVNGKKASPQIFTSNPLTALVNKIYALFDRNARRKQQAAYAAGMRAAGQITPAELLAQAPQDAQAAAQERNSAQNTQQERGSSSSARYDYGQASMLNEDGEWVLVRQTAPDAAQRGMHEINSSDTPYDRLVRQERAAKYTRKLAQPAQSYPDSKLARLFRPIKNFFSGFGAEPAPTGPAAGAEEEEAFALASSAGLGKDRHKRGDTYKRADAPTMGLGGGQNGLGRGEGGKTLSLAEIINPEANIEQIKDNILTRAEETLSKPELAELKEKLEIEGGRILHQAKEKLKSEILEAAEGQEPQNLLEKTFASCFAGASLYSSAKHTTCSLRPDKDKLEDIRKEVKKTQQQSLKQLGEAAGTTLETPPNAIVLLGKTKDLQPKIDPNDLSYPDKQLVKEFYDFMLEQKNCQKETCYWVATDIQPVPNLRHSIQSSGFEFLGDPHNSFQKLYSGFINKKQNDTEALMKLQSSDSNRLFPTSYVAYTQKELDEIHRRNQWENIVKNPQEAVFLYIPAAANAAEIIDTLPNPGMVWVDKTGEILDESKTHDDFERGELIRQISERRIEEYKELARQANKELTERGLAELAKAMAERTAREMKENAKKGLRPTDIDDTGLTYN